MVTDPNPSPDRSPNPNLSPDRSPNPNPNVTGLSQVAALLYLVRTLIPPNQLSIVFTATRHHSEFLHALFKVRAAINISLPMSPITHCMHVIHSRVTHHIHNHQTPLSAPTRTSQDAILTVPLSSPSSSFVLLLLLLLLLTLPRSCHPHIPPMFVHLFSCCTCVSL